MCSYAFNLSLPGALKLFSGCASPGMVSGANKQKAGVNNPSADPEHFRAIVLLPRSCNPNYKKPKKLTILDCFIFKIKKLMAI
jgi:hypothetical protein